MAYNTGAIFDNIGAAFFGDGSDGDLVYDGSAAVLGVTPVGSVYTLDRDVLASNMAVNAGVQVFANGYRIYVRNKLTVFGGGSIHCNGGNANGAGAGLSYTSQGTLGATGLTGSLGLAANSTIRAGISNTALTGSCIGGTGGRGGSVTGGAGGTGSTQTSNPNFSFYNVITATSGKIFLGAYTNPFGGGGGGGGAISGASGNSGGGGGGAGTVLVCAYTLNNLGTISANGGKGGDATGGATNAGGGGGGNGGLVIVSYRNLASQGTITASGGSAGSGVGESLSPTAGSSGRVVLMRL